MTIKGGLTPICSRNLVALFIIEGAFPWEKYGVGMQVLTEAVILRDILMSNLKITSVWSDYPCGSAVAYWFVLSPRNQRVDGSIPAQRVYP